MATTIPRPDVEVTESQSGGTRKVNVVISRDGKGKSYSGEGATSTEAIKETVRKIIDDPHTAEWLPGRKG